jgi:predicted dehydrogenase
MFSQTEPARGEAVRVGVLGCGYWGPKHVRVASNLPSVSSVSVIDGRADRLAAVSRSFPAVGCFSSLEEALPHVDAVVIATPPSTHVALACEAMSAGKHVLVEKPLATTVADAEFLVAAADSAGVVLMVGHTFEYNSAVWKLRELVSSGELGELYYLDSARLNLGLCQSDVDVIFDLAPHDVSIINYVLNSTPSSVQAWGAKHAHGLADVAYLRLDYADRGVSANVHVSWLDPCKVRRVTAVGSRKMAVYNDLASEERIRIHDKGVVTPAPDDMLGHAPMSYRYGDVVSPYLTMDEPLSIQDEHFVECILTGKRPQSDGRSGLSVVRVLEAAHESIDTRSRIALRPEVPRPSRGPLPLPRQLAGQRP